MQKVVRRTRLAQNQSRRRTRIFEAKVLKRDRRLFIEQVNRRSQESRTAVKDERQLRRGKWELGSLAPWHEAGGADEIESQRGRNAGWGAFSQDQAQMIPFPKAEWLKQHQLVIREGDRVCVMEGREGVKGKIGIVQSIDVTNHSVRVEGLNMIDVEIPRSRLSQSTTSPVQTSEASIPYSALRLVYPMPSQRRKRRLPAERRQDAILTNLVLRHVKPWERLSEVEERDAFERARQDTNKAFLNDQSRPRFDDKRGPLYRFLIPENIRIPWPSPPQNNPRDERADTKQTSTETYSFLPTLLRPPMPESIIDELRNRFSVFRVRHDDDYIASKEAEDTQTARAALLSKEMKDLGTKNIARRSVISQNHTWSSEADQTRKILAQLGSRIASKHMSKA